MTKTNKRRVATIVSLVLIACIAIGGTIAWLTDTTNSVENTFTVGKVDIDLTETKPTNNTAKMIPGSTIDKDPKITVAADSEDCYVFVKIVETNNVLTSESTKKFINWTVASGWTQGDGSSIPSNVWYRADGTANAEFPILTDNKVAVESAITSADMTAAANAQPKLTFTGYAIQKDNVTDAAAGWAALNA